MITMRHHRDMNPRGSSHMSLIIRISNTYLSLYITCTDCILLLSDNNDLFDNERLLHADMSILFHHTKNNFAFKKFSNNVKLLSNYRDNYSENCKIQSRLNCFIITSVIH